MLVIDERLIKKITDESKQNKYLLAQSPESKVIHATIKRVRQYDRQYHQPFIDAAELMIKARDSGGDDWWQGFDMLEKAYNNYCESCGESLND